MMTLEEMKLAVCERLPDLVRWSQPSVEGRKDPLWNTGWRTGCPIHWPTEGLQVCHEAEEIALKPEDWFGYLPILHEVCDKTISKVVHSTYEQRLEALCRVWFPERFKD